MQISKQDIINSLSALRKAEQVLVAVLGSYEPKHSTKKLNAFTKFDEMYEGGSIKKPAHLKAKRQ